MEYELKQGRRYLIEDGKSLIEIKILETTEKAIKLKFCDTNTDQWYKKENFKFSIFDELPDIFNQKSILEQKLEWELFPAIKQLTWDEAIKYADLLGEGWRLPTKNELQLAYISKIKGFMPDYYWSSDTYEYNKDYALVYYFLLGKTDYCTKTSSKYLRLVRNI